MPKKMSKRQKQQQPELPGFGNGRRWETVTLTGNGFLKLCAELDSDKSRWLAAWDMPRPGIYICHVKHLPAAAGPA